MSDTRDGHLWKLEEKVRSCRADVLRDASGTVGDHALEQLSADDESRDNRLESLGDALMTLWVFSGRVGTLEEAIAAYEEALQLRPLGHDRRATALNDLGRALQQLCDVVKDTTRLERCILLHRAALQLCPPGHPTRGVSLGCLALALQTRFEQQGGLKTLDEVIELFYEALQLRPSGHPGRDVLLSNLGNSLQIHFQQQGGLETLDKAIALHRESLQLRPPGHPSRDASLNNLANSLQARFEQKGGLHMLDEAITLYYEALQLHPPGHPTRDASLNNLANSLRMRFEDQGDLEILDGAIILNREALQLRPPGHPARHTSLNNLAMALQIRFTQQEDLEMLDEAIALHRESLQLRSPGHPGRYTSLNNLATTLQIRFEQQGGLKIQDEVIVLYREAVQLCPSGHPTRDASLNNLANSLHSRFQHHGGFETLDEFIKLHRETLRLRPLGHPYRNAALENLATSLRTCFEQQGTLKALDEAIELHREALEFCPYGHPTRSSALGGLASSLWTRFQHQGDLETLDEAIKLFREALQLCPIGHPLRNITLTNLASSLQTRFEQQGCSEASDLDEAIKLHGEALQLCPPGHSSRFQSLFAFARCFLISRSQRFDFTTAATYISEALVDNAANIQGRLSYARSHLPAIDNAYAIVVKDTGRIIQAEHGDIILQLYSQAIQLLPRAANFGLDSSTRLQAIVGSDQLSRDAAVRAIGLGRLEEAVEMLEEGRGVFWSQTLHLRSAGLNGVPEDDRRDLERIFGVLQSNSSMISNASQPVEDLERAVSARRTLNEEAEALISKIRTYSGLERFLLPPAFDSLMASLPGGFVVIVNSSRLGSHALLLDRAAGLAKSLAVTANVTSFDLKKARTRLPRDMGSEELNLEADEETRGIKVAGRQVTTFEDTLQSMWISLVHPVLLALGLKKAEGNARPRLWWCATGDYGFLPIHAAGEYSLSGNVECTSDYVVSSYTPTLSALTKARDGWRAIPCHDVKSLVICEESLGSSRLPNVEYEAELVRGALESAKTQVVNPSSTHTLCSQMRSMLAESDAQLLHLASHGVQKKDPLKSAFLMQDGGFSIQDLMELNLPHAVLAYLSACETAKGDERAPDQAVHLAASMLFCGFRSVIGTMWLMSDEDGPKVAKAMYERLFEKNQLDLDDIPYALDGAVRALRDGGVPAKRWALYMHMGG